MGWLYIADCGPPRLWRTDMSSAKKELGFNATASIARLRQICAEASDALLTEGYVQPDHELLDLCAMALHHLTHAQQALEARRRVDWCDHPDPQRQEASRKEDRVLFETWKAAEARGRAPLYWIAKKKATTPAGIYAKAMVCRTSRTGAAGLAMSLAIDLLACKELRESLWPADKVELPV